MDDQFDVIDVSGPTASIKTLKSEWNHQEEKSNLLLKISAHDNASGISGWFVGSQKEIPNTSDTPWESLTTTNQFNDNLSVGIDSNFDEPGGLFIWFKDAVGNVSEPYPIEIPDPGVNEVYAENKSGFYKAGSKIAIISFLKSSSRS